MVLPENNRCISRFFKENLSGKMFCLIPGEVGFSAEKSG
jgi:hypothetical protein